MFRLLWVLLGLVTLVAFWRYRRMRKWLLGAALVGVVTTYGYVLTHDAPAPNSIDPQLVEVTQVVVGGDSRITTLSARIANHSDEEIGRISLRLSRTDCVPAGCEVIGAEDADVSITIPANQTRQIKASFAFTNQPDLLGVEGWDYQITAITAAN